MAKKKKFSEATISTVRKLVPIDDAMFQKMCAADEIFESENSANSTWTWILRIAGIFLVIFSLKMIFGFIETILKVVPFVSNIVGWGVGIVCTIVGFVWSIIVIAIAWIFYRPLLGIALLVIAGLLIWLFAFKGKDKLKELANKNKE